MMRFFIVACSLMCFCFHQRVEGISRRTVLGFTLSPRCTHASRLQMQGGGRKYKEIILRDECRNNLLEGIEQVASAVRVTLGPRGRNVLLEKEYGPPMIVNDGVTIARNIELKDRRLNAGAKLVQEVASTSDERAGDGTTSTTVITSEICKQGVKYVNQGHNPIPIQKGIQKAAKMMMEEVKRLATPVGDKKDLLNIATVATSGNGKMGEIIARAFDKLGATASTVLEDHPSIEDELEFSEGYTFDRGYASPYFLAGEERDVLEFQNPKVLIADHKIESAQSILRLLEHFVKTKEPLVIIAEDFGQESMQTLIINKMRGLLKVVAIKAPSFGERRKEYLRDIAVAMNASLISRDLGMNLEDVTPDMLGEAQGVVIRKERTSMITYPRFKPEISARITALQLEREKSTSKYDKDKIDERIAALAGGIARIMVGAATETEQKEKKLRYEDAINAVRAAMETGYVPGGGVTYLQLSAPTFKQKVLHQVESSAKLENVVESADSATDESTMTVFPFGSDMETESEIDLQKTGASIMLNAVQSVTKQIAENAGISGQRIVDTILNSGKGYGFGWNAKTGKFGDMISMGVIDPAKVVVAAIENAASVAGLVLTTEGMMVEREEDSSGSNNMDHHGMGGGGGGAF